MTDQAKPDHGADPLGNGQWRLVPSGQIVGRAEYLAWREGRKQREVRNDCVGLSWSEIESKQGGKLTK